MMRWSFTSLLKYTACENSKINVITGKINGKKPATGCKDFNITLYKNPSICCACGTFGCRNMGSLSKSPYNNSKKLL